MAKLTLKATISAALSNGTATLYDNGKTVLYDGTLYVVRADGFRRMPAQKQNRRRLDIVLPKPAPVKAEVHTGFKVITGPAASPFRKRAATLDFVRYALKHAPAPSLKIS